MKTKIFLDSCDPKETKEIISILGFLDGQTTNPTLVAKNPYAKERFLKGDKFTKEEIFDFYKKNIKEISELIPNGSVSVEVYADENTTADDMFKQGSEMFEWIPNAHVKYPITKVGLEVAEKSIKNGMRVNMTLCFNQEQAGAVYSATLGAKKGDVFVSPFVGRLDDIGENGMSLIENIIKIYKGGDAHVEILSASVRSMTHFMASLALGADIITAPFSILKEWGEVGMPVPESYEKYDFSSLKNIPYKEIDLNKNYKDFNIENELTDKGLKRFASDWNALIK
jgi:transaldolase